MKLKLVKKIVEAKDTKSFFFDKPEGFEFQAGQYLYLTLLKLNYTDERGATRHFTISSSPTEDFIQVTTRIRETSGYKKTLDELPIGAIVEGKSPQGTFTFDQNLKNNAFLAGGIGITPFRSMVKYVVDKKLNIPMHLIYSNSDSDFIFKNELDNWKKVSDFLKIQYVNTSETGHLDSKMIEKFIKDWALKSNDCTFWIVGPNVFVDAMENSFEELNVLDTKIKTEKFTGY